MKHARPDYNRIKDPAGLIPADEPVFLIRAQDITSADVVDFWVQRAEAAGASPGLLNLARQQAAAMRAWPAKKVPDL